MSKEDQKREKREHFSKKAKKSKSDEFEIQDHLISFAQLEKKYATDLDVGLTEAVAQERLMLYGPNRLKQMKPPSLVKIFLMYMFGGFAGLLWVGVLLSYGVYITGYFNNKAENEQLYLGSTLLLVIIITGTFGFYQEAITVSVIEGFKNMVPRTVKVIRGGEQVTLYSEDIVVGDLVCLESGCLIPADIRVIDSNSMKVDNSTITGESEPLNKTPDCTDTDPLETQNLVFCGTYVVEGTALGIVIATGDDTFLGHIAGITSAIKKVHLMKKELDTFNYVITIVALLIGMMFFGLALFVGYSALDATMFFIAIIVANIPEGLLVTLTACLTIAGKRMASKNCLVKTLQSIETLGATSVICSDKTGTLTQNKMNISHMYYNEKMVDVLSSSYRLDTSICLGKLCRIGILCNLACYHPTDGLKPPSQRRIIGNASEAAIFMCMERLTGDCIEKRFKNPMVCEIPFNSTNKFHVTIHKLESGQYLIAIKGAPEVILARSSTIFMLGATHDIETYRSSLRRAIFDMSNMGERVLGFAEYELPVDEFPEDYGFDNNEINFPLTGFRFIGLMSMLDPPKDGVFDAVKKCKTAGIRVVMVTGDHPVTAVAIAKKVGIMSLEKRSIYDIANKLGRSAILLSDEEKTQANAIVISGPQLREMSREEIEDVVTSNDEIIFARTTPKQKLKIVEAFQNVGEIVAVTGDGVNDAAALKKADIGVSMGISGSDVSKEAADMILLDDNFSTIVTGIEEGRIVFENLKKSIAYTLTAKSPQVLSFMIYVFFNVPVSLTVIGILMVDVVTDLWPGLSLAYEPGEADIMTTKPRDVERDKMINHRLILFAYFQIGTIQAFAAFLCYFTTLAQYGFFPSTLLGIRERWEDKSINDLKDSYGIEWSHSERKELERKGVASYYLAIVVTQIADVIICKSRRISVFTMGMKNWVMNFGILFAIGISLIVVYTPYVNTSLTLSSVHWTAIMPSIPFFIIIIVYDEVRRYFVRNNPNGWVYMETYF